MMAEPAPGSRNIYQATQIRRGGGRTVTLRELSFVFDCPSCEYVMTALTHEGAEALEHAHMVTMPSTHLAALAETTWCASPLSRG